MNRTRIFALLTAALVFLGAFALVACGDDDGGGSAKATPTDRAFAVGMVPHHQMAIQMAEIAKENGSHQQIATVADDIISAQTAEISQLKTIDGRLADAGVKTGDLGMTDAEMGMDMNMGMLESKEGFDRMFIDMMVLHHQGAIRMARAQLANGEDGELSKIAQEVIAAQSKEIEQMNEWRTAWYGAPSPSGGVPADDEGSSSGDSLPGMDHSG